MNFTFNTGAVSGVGGFINYCPECEFGPMTIEALGAGNVLLELFNIENDAPMFTGGRDDAGAFRGIQSASNDIVALCVSGRIATLDDLSFVRSQSNSVPEPTTLPMLGVGLLGAGVTRRRRKI